ncbi:hypothetical protein SXCC_02079 [Gluconacetobacter sp. SXCC-1]|nr:hypothetical protein SXCC_02079 [Gluconacetobacter sp. SXCC-1]
MCPGFLPAVPVSAHDHVVMACEPEHHEKTRARDIAPRPVMSPLLVPGGYDALA